jgi:hypothetical protein
MSGIDDRRSVLHGDVSSDMVSRMQLYDGDRDLHETLGYDDALEVGQFWDLYTRADIAKAIIDTPVQATWTDGFTIHSAEYDTPPERGVDGIHDQFESVKRDVGLHSEFVTADIVSRIGRFGVMVLMVNDGRALDQPVGDATELKDVQPLSERRVVDYRLGENPTNPRYNLPVEWELDFTDDDDAGKDVHWTRVVHIAEQQREHPVYGIPALEPVYNRVMDWQKLIGGAAEMFWRGADRKMVATLDPDAGRLDDESDLQAQIEEMRHGLRDTVYGRGLGIEQLDGEDVDPSGVKNAILDAISSETGIPKRILIGSERGDLASTQDRANFYGNISDRRANHAEADILRPFVDRLQRATIVPDGDYRVFWPSVHELGESERAEVQATRAEAISKLNDVDWISEQEKRELVGLGE